MPRALDYLVQGHEENPPYGNVFHVYKDNGYFYKPEDISPQKATIHELLLKHYYLTMRLDGYGHLTASEEIFHNCQVFRDELHRRGVDAVQHCVDMEMWYDWGYREVITEWRPLGWRNNVEG